MTIPVDPIAVALSVARVLDALGIVHTIGGSIASSIAGEPRSTIDIVAALREFDVPALRSALSADFYVDEEALRRAVREHSSVNLIHQGTQLKVDNLRCGRHAARRAAVASAAGNRDAPGRTLHVHPPEDILLQKLRWYGRGGETSERQWRDILGIIRVQAQRLDRDYLRVNAPVLGVADLLARALREAADEG